MLLPSGGLSPAGVQRCESSPRKGLGVVAARRRRLDVNFAWQRWQSWGGPARYHHRRYRTDAARRGTRRGRIIIFEIEDLLEPRQQLIIL